MRSFIELTGTDGTKLGVEIDCVVSWSAWPDMPGRGTTLHLVGGFTLVVKESYDFIKSAKVEYQSSLQDPDESETEDFVM